MDSFRPCILWLTGLSGAGKSTLAVELKQRLGRKGIPAAIVDGDVLRAGLNRGLGFSEEDRRENIRRAGEVALLMAQNGMLVIAALISPYRRDRQQIASRAQEEGVPFFEIFVNAPLAACETRDPKQLYKRARSGTVRSFTGIDSPYEAPTHPALELHTSLESAAESSDKLFRFASSVIEPDMIGPTHGKMRRGLFGFWRVWTPSFSPRLAAVMFPASSNTRNTDRHFSKDAQ